MKRKATKSKRCKHALIHVTLTFDPNLSGTSAGLRIGWVSGQDRKEEIDLTCGAGVGNPFLTFSRKDKKTKETRYAVADIRTIIEPLSKALAALQ